MLTIKDDSLQHNLSVRRDLLAVLQSAVDNDLARGNIRVFPGDNDATDDGRCDSAEYVFNQCGGEYGCGNHVGDFDTAQGVLGRTACGICCTRRYLFSAIPSDCRLYVTELKRLLGDFSTFDPRGGTSGTGSATYRGSPVQVRSSFFLCFFLCQFCSVQWRYTVPLTWNCNRVSTGY